MVPSAKNDREPQKYAFVDSLRGWAILLVILTHAGQGATAIEALTHASASAASGLRLPQWLAAICGSAQGGVQLFFVVSAFSLTLSWLSRGGGRGATVDFLLRRFFRIAPMFYVGILLYLMLYGMEPRFAAPRGITIPDVLLTFGFLNVWKENALNSVVPGDWSVGCEATFYMLLPIVMNYVRSPISMIGITFVVAIATEARLHYMALHHTWTDLSYFEFWNQFAVFLFGVLAALVAKSPAFLRFTRAFNSRIAGTLVTTMIFSAIIAGVPLLNFQNWYIETNMQIGALSAALCIGLYSFDNPILVNRVLGKVGRTSFSMYLLHFSLLIPSLHMAQAIMHGLMLRAGGPLLLSIYYPILTAMTFIVASVAFRFVEQPCIAMGRRIIASRHGVLQSAP